MRGRLQGVGKFKEANKAFKYPGILKERNSLYCSIHQDTSISHTVGSHRSEDAFSSMDSGEEHGSQFLP